MIARVLESQGIATVTLNMFEEVAEYVRAPRTVMTEFPFGAPFGHPDNNKLHTTILRECLKALENDHSPGFINKLSYKWIEKL